MSFIGTVTKFVGALMSFLGPLMSFIGSRMNFVDVPMGYVGKVAELADEPMCRVSASTSFEPRLLSRIILWLTGGTAQNEKGRRLVTFFPSRSALANESDYQPPSVGASLAVALSPLGASPVGASPASPLPPSVTMGAQVDSKLSRQAPTEEPASSDPVAVVSCTVAVDMPMVWMFCSAVRNALLHKQSAAHAVSSAAHFVSKHAQSAPPSIVAGSAAVILTQGAAASSGGVEVSLPPESLPPVTGGGELLLEHATATAPAPKREAPKKNRQIRMMKPSRERM
jgi:hypothetical protein